MPELEIPDGPLLAIFAHPDDELFISPVLSNYARKGVDCYLAIATDGRFGIQPHTGGIGGEDLVQIRSAELNDAAQVLGIHEPIQLGFEDGFAHKTPDLKEILAQYSQLYRRVQQLFEDIQPGLVITFGGDGIYAHPDHLMVGNAVTSAYQATNFTHDASLYYPGVCQELMPEGLVELVAVDAGTIPLFPVARRHLPVRIEVDRIDLETARRSMACHKSQFVEEQFKLVSGLFHGNTTIYFRNWTGSTEISNTLIKP